ncbi:D-arabinono-1,4-lactone oxidase-domain-containing protein [Triangularia verruculosa]|uniref:D-arabinono-1,4-lactone oxidase n=1 Tax=Triangularia verruculosa TaxID=2587418 RepID=A0AAN6XF85_9PEZI|nr:D-arabinono-1,4-lactone oxidase-domain-containing protein [Triangularia verruculosa]
MASTTEDLSHLPLEIRSIITSESSDGTPFPASPIPHTHRTWARTFSSHPEVYLQPSTLPQITKITNLARRCRRRLVVVGSGHSPSNLTCTSSWMVNLDKYSRVLSIDPTTGLCVLQSGIRLWQLSEALNKEGFALPSMGSINEQSIVGAITTGTHGSSLKHGLISEGVESLKIVLANGEEVSCSPTERQDLFRAALLSLGAIGIVTEVTFRAVKAFSLAWEQQIDPDSKLFAEWESKVWKQSEFVRVWWFPYMRRAVVWKADKVDGNDLDTGIVKNYDPPTSFQDGKFGYFVYHNLLALARWFPRITPWVEWFVFGLQYGFGNGEATVTRAVQPSYKAFLLNCLYSQFVNEWAIPLEKGPEALQRLAAWLHRLQPGDEGYVEHKIPFSAEGLWVHSPVEVRVSDTTVKTSAERGNRPWLDITPDDGPALYLNATMYRPYLRDPSYNATERYYEAFEWLMRDLGGKPHWAKTFAVTPEDFASKQWYGENFHQFRKVRDEVDPLGMFVGPWQRKFLLGEPAEEEDRLALEEVGFEQKPAKDGGFLVTGHQNAPVA